MKNRFTILVFFLICSLQLTAQKHNFSKSVMHYLNINGTTEQYEHAVSSLFVMLKKQYASKNVPETVWEELKTQKPIAVNQIKGMLVSTYQSHFDETEIANMVKFYETPTGQQMVKDQTKLTQKDREEMAAFYNSETGKKVLGTSESLNKSVSGISEDWSRDLYQSITSKLAEKGYAL